MTGYWDVLGIEPTTELIAIKRAYATRLKFTRPDDDAAAYQALREAYDWALEQAKAVRPSVVMGGECTSNEPALTFNQFEPDSSAQWKIVLSHTHPDLDLVFQVEPLPQAANVEQSHHVHAGSDLQEVAQAVVLRLRDSEEADIQRIWPELQGYLNELPLSLRDQASVCFAQIVIDERYAPISLLRGLQDHFAWGTDFRGDRLLGPARSHALRSVLLIVDHHGSSYYIVRPE